jgi:Major Facilitator Superfamily
MFAETVTKTDALARLDNMPWTGFHTTMTIALGVGWTLDSFETNIIGSMFGVIKKQWHLTPTQSSLAVTVWLCGMLIGAIGFGYLADRFGRKRLFLARARTSAFEWPSNHNDDCRGREPAICRDCPLTCSRIFIRSAVESYPFMLDG